jgi:hypothetical protein
MDTLSFFVGFFVGIFATILVISEGKKKLNDLDQDDGTKDPEMDDHNEYYVKLPYKAEIVRIMIEEPLDLNHRVTLDGTTYKVVAVDHKENGHTVFTLTYHIND